MIYHPRRPVQTDHHTNQQKRRRDNPQRVLVREADGEDGRGELPRRGVEGVGEPVGD